MAKLAKCLLLNEPHRISVQKFSIHDDNKRTSTTIIMMLSKIRYEFVAVRVGRVNLIFVSVYCVYNFCNNIQERCRATESIPRPVIQNK